MEAHGKKRRMVVNLDILKARNVIIKPDAAGRDSLFVRYYFSTGNGQGNKIAMNTRQILATPDPKWKQTFCLECGGIMNDNNVISELQKQFVRFELRQRSSKVKILGNMFRSSKVVGSVEIAWKDLLASPTLSINSWYPLIPAATISGGSELPAPSLHLAISLKSVVDSVSQQAPQEHDQEAMSCRNEMRRNYMNVNRRIKHLERNDYGCGRKFCCQLTLDEEGIFAGVV